MVHHIVLWNFKPEMTEQEREEAGTIIRSNLEALKTMVPGIISLQVVVNELDSSSKDLGLISEFENVVALAEYQAHPAHVQAAAYIKTVTCDRACFDYVE